MEARVSLAELYVRFPRDEYGRDSLILIQDPCAMSEIFDDIGLPQQERDYGHLFVAYDIGDITDTPEIVGVFGTFAFTPLVLEFVDILWWKGALAPAFEESRRYWAEDAKGREKFIWSD